ncbi:hypothetical protein Taro_021607, partial [Colocasia esculenta]|nr:hypothetical protein [Colocasia esculenta]
LQDLIGYGGLGVREELEEAFRGQVFASPLVELMVESGRTGKRNGRGYYIYEKGSKPRPDQSILSIVEESKKRSNIMPGGQPISISDGEILEMIFFPVVNEACRVMGEGIVARASDLDIASVLGMGFPNYRGGIVFWADSIGPGYIDASLSKWTETYGNFFRSSRYLEERAKKAIA